MRLESMLLFSDRLADDSSYIRILTREQFKRDTEIPVRKNIKAIIEWFHNNKLNDDPLHPLSIY